MNPVVRVRFPPEFESLAYARLVLRRVILDGDADDPLYFSAFTEVASNAIRAHERLGSAEPISVAVVEGEEASVTVSDSGGGFDVDDPGREPFVGGGGLGLTIARAVCPTMTIDSSPAGTVVGMPFPGRDPLPEGADE